MDIISYAMGKQQGGTAPTGTLDITSNGEHDVTNYATANVNVESVNINDYFVNPIVNIAAKNLMKRYPDNISLGTITSLSSMFKEWGYLEQAPQFDTTNITNMNDMFNYCSELNSVPLYNTANVTNFSQMFYYCKKLTSAPAFNMSSATNINFMFYTCNKLASVPVFNWSSVLSMNNIFYDCYSLSNDSVNNIMASCISATSYTGTKTLKQLGVPQSKRQIASGLSNYQAFLDAGWTTGD